MGPLLFCRTGRRRLRYRLLIPLAASSMILFVYVIALHKRELADGNLLRPREMGMTNEHLAMDTSDSLPYRPPEQACVHPKLEMYPSQQYKNFFKFEPKPNCPGEDWVYIDNGTFRISKTALSKRKNIVCDFIPLIRGNDDFTYYEGERVRAIKDGTSVTSDAAKVHCYSDKESYENLHAAIAPNPKLLRKSESVPLPKEALGLDVLMFGFDSVSRMTWMRKLPETYNYLVKVLKSVVLEGYNIVGDGTPQALLPILCGKTEWELPEARRGHQGAKTVDNHPWIYKDFSKAGYVTQWIEDQPSVGTYTYRMLGFKEPPTDHYIRHFYLELDKRMQSNARFCLGSRLRHNVMLNWVKDLFLMYKDKRKFSFGFHAECSHGNSNLLSMVDDDLKNWLEFLFSNNYLNKTLLIIMSDHGARFQNLRETVQGKQEERNPFFSIRLPEWFQKAHPTAYKNLLTNAKRLTTPFDIHETFLHVLNFSKISNDKSIRRGMSLFTEIPAARTCAHADIEPHWCNCLAWQKIDKNNATVKRASAAFLDLVNSLTDRFRTKCALLHIDSIRDSVIYSPGEGLLKFKRSSDHDGRVADLSSNTKEDVSLYQLKITTKPGGGNFEATIKHDIKSDKFSLNVREISRTNAYGDAPACVAAEYPHLRPYCYCEK